MHKVNLSALCITVLASLGLAASASAEPVYTLAHDVVSNTQDVIDASYNMGDYGQAVNDLVNFNRSAQQFAYSLNYNDFQYLRSAYSYSRNSWQYLRASQSMYQTLTWIDGDMQSLIQQMNGPGPGPGPGPHGQVITVTGKGAGGTTQGDKSAACQRAQDRAVQDAIQSCSNQWGQALQTHAGSCHCHNVSNSHEHIDCDADAWVSCQLH